MQPYFFPYVGYFQLIQSADIYINLDHVAFTKRSYMTRNVLKNNINISVPVIKASQNRSCVEVFTLSEEIWFKKFYKTLEINYKKEPYFCDVFESILNPWRGKTCGSKISISEFNFIIISKICNYLDIQTKLVSTSVGLTKNNFNLGLQDIVRNFNGDHYINSIGGKELYSKEDFREVGIKLNFIQMDDLEVENPYISILDLLFKYDKEYIKTQLEKYTLV